LKNDSLDQLFAPRLNYKTKQEARLLQG